MSNIDFGRVRALFLDSDGVLTDGGVFYDEDGRGSRRFDIKDGAGIKGVMASGRSVAIISSAAAQPVAHRARQLGISHCYTGEKDKLRRATALCAELGVELSEVAFIGDDVADLGLLQAVGLPIAVADATEAVKSAVAYVTQGQGGHGAVREVCDLILAAEGNSVAKSVEH